MLIPVLSNAEVYMSCAGRVNSVIKALFGGSPMSKEGYKHYRKLNKRELLELLIEESEKSEELERQLKIASEQLASRELVMNTAGSLAEASLTLNGVFKAADEACAQYIESIKNQNLAQEKIIAERDAESRKRAKRIIMDAMQRARSIEAEARAHCEETAEKTVEKTSFFHGKDAKKDSKKSLS